MTEKTFNPDPNISNRLKDFQPDFKPLFESRVMDTIAQLSEQSYNQLFNRAFQRIVLSGVAALIALIVTISMADGSLSTDTLLGTANLDIETLTAMTISGF